MGAGRAGPKHAYAFSYQSETMGGALRCRDRVGGAPPTQWGAALSAVALLSASFQTRLPTFQSDSPDQAGVYERLGTGLLENAFNGGYALVAMDG